MPKIYLGQDCNKIYHNSTLTHLESIGKSLKGRNLPVIDIYDDPKKGKDIIVLLTRQHPPEVTGYFAFEQFLTTLLEENQLSTDFFKNYRVIAFPIVNPDGVDMGHWKKKCKRCGFKKRLV